MYLGPGKHKQLPDIDPNQILNILRPSLNIIVWENSLKEDCYTFYSQNSNFFNIVTFYYFYHCFLIVVNIIAMIIIRFLRFSLKYTLSN